MQPERGNRQISFTCGHDVLSAKVPCLYLSAFSRHGQSVLVDASSPIPNTTFVIMNFRLLLLPMAVFYSFVSCRDAAIERTLIHVSYDPTREFFQEINEAFGKSWSDTHNREKISIRLSHGGSGKQARAVIDGLSADVVSLAIAPDIDAISREAHLLPLNWRTRFPDNGTPFTSTVVFLVRKGNPKQINDWPDLIRPGVRVVTPNPKTSGGARLNYLAAWGSAFDKHRSEVEANAFVAALFQNVALLDASARAATTTFVRRRIGDVLITWENEAYLALQKMGASLEVVYPSVSILTEPAVAVVEANAKRTGTLDLAHAYLEFLYSDEGQEIAMRHFFRPRRAKFEQDFFPKTPAKFLRVEKDLGGWSSVNKKHFADGGLFEKLYDKRS